MIPKFFINHSPLVDMRFEEGYWNVSPSSSTLQRKIYLLMFGISISPCSLFSIIHYGPIYHIPVNMEWRSSWFMISWWYFDTDSDFSSDVKDQEMVFWCKIPCSYVYGIWGSFRFTFYSIILQSMWIPENFYSCSNEGRFLYFCMWLL